MKRAAKKSKLITKAYNQAKSNFIQSQIGEITPMHSRPSEHDGLRFNLLVPSINKEHIFGGISTALKFFEQLVPEGAEKRIILTDASPNEDDLMQFPQYSQLSCDEDETLSAIITPFNDRYERTIPVRKSDIFIATAWWTAYSAQRMVEWQAQQYKQDRRHIIYFIQDYEPCFYPWSSQSILAESTYRYDGPQIGVFNTSLLRDYTLSQGHGFTKIFSFEPRMNKELLEELVKANLNEKKKRILVYGRPSVARNAFTLIMETLRIWTWHYGDARNWEVVSVGEDHPDIDIGNGISIRSMGKMSLSEYATMLIESAVGVSLMVSPHPSYPPLEMAHFGMKVLTNSYANKNLSKWHDNIVSVDDLTPSKMAERLGELCDQFEQNQEGGRVGDSRMPEYLRSGDPFPFVDKILDELKK